MSADSRIRILTDSARKRNRKEVLANYNTTIINIHHQHNRWMKFKLKCKHQCHCACSLELETCIINYSGRQAAHKNQPKYMFYTRIEGKY